MADDCGISCEIACKWSSLGLTDDKSMLVLVMALCHQQQAITRAMADPILCHYIMSLGHKELMMVLVWVHPGRAYRALAVQGVHPVGISRRWLILPPILGAYGKSKVVRAQFNIKMSSYQYRRSHCVDKMVVRSSYLHNGISYTGKKTSLYWISPLMTLTLM